MRSLYLLQNLYYSHQESSPNLKLLYLLYAVRTAVFSYLALFLPYFYFQDFVSAGLSNQQALIYTLLVFLLFQLAHVFGSLWAVYLSQKTSVKQTLWLSILVLAITTLMLSVRSNSLIMYVSGIGFGLHSGLWWITYHLEFVMAGEKNSYGKEVGIRQAMGIAVGSGLTLLSGLLISQFGFMVMYLTTTIILLFMLFTINALADHHLKALPFNWQEIVATIKRYPADFRLYFGVGAENFVAEIIWPLLLFVVFTQPLTVGLVTVFVTLLAFVVRLIAGNWLDHHQPQEVKKMGIVTVSLIYLGKLLSQYPLSLIFFDSLHRVFTAFYYLPAVTLNYFRSLTENKTVYVLSREIVSLTGKIMALIIAVILIQLGINLWHLLFIGVFGPLVYFLPSKIQLRK